MYVCVCGCLYCFECCCGTMEVTMWPEIVHSGLTNRWEKLSFFHDLHGLWPKYWTLPYYHFYMHREMKNSKINILSGALSFDTLETLRINLLLTDEPRWIANIMVAVSLSLLTRELVTSLVGVVQRSICDPRLVPEARPLLWVSCCADVASARLCLRVGTLGGGCVRL